MAKRARGTTTRPGQRAPLPRGATRPPLGDSVGTPRPVTLTDEEEARAAELEARIVAAEREAEASTRRRDRPRRTADGETPIRAGSLTVRASQEYGYVVRDVRRIALIGGSLVAFLIGLWAIVQATGIGPF